MVIFVAVLAGMALPITPVQILWVNMVSAATLGMALAWERSEGDIMHRPPRPPDEPLLTPFLLWRTGFVGLILLLGAGSLFLYEQANEATSLEFARTMAVNALVTGEIFYLVNARFRHAASFTLDGLFGSRAVMIAIAVCISLQMLFIYAPFMNTLFATEPLDMGALLRCVAVGVAVFVLVELEKVAFRRWWAPAAAAAGKAQEGRTV
jgi:magnesium-transporting ATPase (P-type)